MSWGSVRITRSARKHRLTTKRIMEALNVAGDPQEDGDALIYVGCDERGEEIEVVLVPDDKHPGGWAAIHAMPPRYRG